MDTKEYSISDRLSNIENLLLKNKAVLNFDEAADFTGLSPSYLYKLTSTGRIPCYKPQGKQLYFNRQELEKWLLRNKVKAREEIDAEACNHVCLKGGRS